MQFSSNLEKFKLGTYTVDEAIYNGATIKLVLLDNISQFDRPYSVSSLTYPASLDTILSNLCSVCGVTRATTSLTFPHNDYVISDRPEDESITCREVLSWVATLAGCFVKCNPNGELDLKWFDTASLEAFETDLDGGTFNTWSAGNTYDGGTFNPWSSGDTYDGGTLDSETGVHYIYGLYSQNIAVDDVVITGVSVTVKDESDTATSDLVTFTSGTSGYLINLDENPFITKTNAQTIVNWLGQQIIGLRFRNLNISITSDPSIESGDVAIVVDRKENLYRALITRVTFSADGNQTIICGADTPARNSANRYSEATKSYVETRKLLKQQKTTYDQALDDLSTAISAKSGLYSTIEATQSGDIFYLHDKPVLAESKVVWKMNAEAIAVTTDYKGSNPSTTVWNFGVQVNGVVVAAILNTIGINASWINSGTVSANYISGGILKLGGSNNGNGTLQIVNASDSQIGKWDKDGISITKGSINLGNGNFVATDSGQITTKNLSAQDSITLTGAAGSSFSFPFTYVTSLVKTFWGDNLVSSGTFTIANNEGIKINNTRVTANAHHAYDDITLQILDGVKVTGLTSLGVNLESVLGPTGYALYKKNTNYPFCEISNVGISIGNGTSQLVSINIDCNGDITSAGSYDFSGTKSRNVHTEDYGHRLLYSYETPSPMFGDVGEGQIAEDGYCYIQIDPVFAETITTNQYQVFLQRYGEGSCHVKSRYATYFIVEGTPNLQFGWEVKAKQSDFDQLRLTKKIDKVNIQNNINYSEQANYHIEELRKERENI